MPPIIGFIPDIIGFIMLFIIGIMFIAGFIVSLRSNSQRFTIC
jgi:hypothetical protein